MERLCIRRSGCAETQPVRVQVEPRPGRSLVCHTRDANHASQGSMGKTLRRGSSTTRDSKARPHGQAFTNDPEPAAELSLPRLSWLAQERPNAHVPDGRVDAHSPA